MLQFISLNKLFSSFSEDGVLVGYKAVAQSEHNPKNTIYDAKRFIGKVFNEEEVQSLQKSYPFKVSQFAKNDKMKGTY
jgi:molecular chaperone DnaK (HSP70)